MGRRGQLGLSNTFRCQLLDRGRIRHRNSRSRLSLTNIILNGIFLEEPEDVIEHKVATRLFHKERCLDKLSPGVAVVGHFADDLDDDTTVGGGLRVYRVNEDFAVLETDGGGLVMDLLNGWYTEARDNWERGEKKKKYLLAETGFDVLFLCAMIKGRGFGVEAMQTVGLFVNIRIILGNKLPSNLGTMF